VIIYFHCFELFGLCLKDESNKRLSFQAERGTQYIKKAPKTLKNFLFQGFGGNELDALKQDFSNFS